MEMKLATLIILLALFAMPTVADNNCDYYIQELKDPTTNWDTKVRDARNLLNCDVTGTATNDSRVEALTLALKDDIEEVRYQAAWSLGNLNDPRAVEPLILALDDEDTSTAGLI